jgi:hypothetical protein
MQIPYSSLGCIIPELFNGNPENTINDKTNRNENEHKNDNMNKNMKNEQLLLDNSNLLLSDGESAIFDGEFVVLDGEKRLADSLLLNALQVKLRNLSFFILFYMMYTFNDFAL